MPKPRHRAAAALAATLVSAPSIAATPQIQAGHYTQLYLVLSASVNGAGSCLDAVGTYFDSQFYYPGPSKKGAKSWRAFSVAGLLENQIITLPETPAAGVTSWSGTYSVVFLPGGKPEKGTFSTSFTPTDTSSLVGTTTNVYKNVSGGTCTETVQFNQFLTGK